MKHISILLAGVLLTLPLAAQVPTTRVLPQPTGVLLLDEARREQRLFEEFRRDHLPLFNGKGLGGAKNVKDRDVVGKFQYWYDESEPPPPPEPASIKQQRERLIGILDTAAKAYPEDDWTNGQLIRYLSEAERTADEITAALRCRAQSWWCSALLGFAYHDHRDFVKADTAFAQALRKMPQRLRCDWTDISVLLDEYTVRAYHRTECGSQERLAYETRLWWLAKPLYSLPGMDTRTEYYSRMTMVRMLEDAPSPHMFGFDIDERELLLRYGWARAWSMEPGRGQVPLFGQRGRGDDPGAPDGSTIISHEPSPSYQFLMPALNSPAMSDSIDWETGVPPVHARYAPMYARKIGALQHQSALFHRGDSSLVVLAWDASGSLLGNSSDRTMALVLARADSLQPAITKVEHAPVKGSMFAKGPWTQLLMSAELTAKGIDTAMRARYGLRPPWGLGARVTLSEMLFFEPYENDKLPNTVEEAAQHAMSSVKIRSTQKLGVFFESYGTNPKGEKLKLTFTVGSDEDPPGRVKRGMRVLGLSAKANPIRVTVEDPSLLNSAMTPRAAYIDIHTLKPGYYKVQLEVEVLGQQYTVSTERALEIVK
ncbi:MAG TPA: hypothetical protein VE967_06475 [Gemmatimonadaceae bacterium]|nr:hypothetical protein [Gemmatimonadaceae bacterium]